VHRRRAPTRADASDHASRAACLLAYAGVPVTALDRRVLGSFCVADRHRREWTTDEIETLRDLAAAAATQIALREAVVGAERLARADAESAQARLAFLAEASIALASSLDYSSTLNRLASLAVPHLGDWCAIELLTDTGAIERLAAAHSDPHKTPLVRERRIWQPLDPAGPHPVAEVARSGRPRVIAHISDDLLRGIYADPDTLTLAQPAGQRSAIIVPLVAHGRVLGAITLSPPESPSATARG
jgi:GAF domain-containing protein